MRLAIPMVISAFLILTLTAAAQDSKLEDRAVAIEGKLMAPCCWSSTISQHYSETADEIRRDIRKMLVAGKSEREILDYYVSVYGERILASPPAHGFNLLAWLLPGIFFLGCAVFVVLLLRRWTLSRSVQVTAEAPGEPLDERYASRLEKELKDFE
jgi:cytochrome c-type biogenesis protein CcmH